MREIKFRAWQPSKKKMWSWLDIELSGKMKDILCGYFLNPMQFTGLHDKNGKEIYEGDILRYNKSPCYIVKWNINGWMMCYTYKGNSGCTYIRGFMEIIGNIFETPELLEDS